MENSFLVINSDVPNDDARQFTEVFFSKKNIIRYVLGRNIHSESIINSCSIDAIIDDYTKEEFWHGLPIVKSSNLSKDSYIVSCSLAIFPHTALNNLKSLGYENVIDYLTLSKYADDKHLEMKLIDDCNKDIKIHYSKYEWVYSRLVEDTSKKVFTDILNFRVNKELDYMNGYEVDDIGQYFEDFLELQDNEVFIDAGGYDGQTSIEFIKHCPKYKAVYIFEPSEENILLAKDNLKDYLNINFISKGLSDKNETLKFDTGSGSASSISEYGTVKIVVDTLDNLVQEKVTFIKMDIEGAEGLAIDGMKRHIQEDHPKLAISVYHKADDFWKIPEQILNIRDDYNIYMRHYTEGTDETVMFFMPRQT